MKAFGGSGVGPPETKAEQRERHRDQAKKGRARIRAMSDKQKVRALGRAIADSVLERGSFQKLDGRQAGFTDREIDQHYDAALAFARTIAPSLCDAAGAH